MRGKRMWILGGLLSLGLGLASYSVRADDGDDEDTRPAPKKTNSGGIHWLWYVPGFDTKKPTDKKPDPKPEKPDKPAAKPPKPAARPVQDAPERVRAREQAAWIRRQQVCLRLKELAEQANDPDLLRTAETLEQRSWNVYLQRTANLPTGGYSQDSDDEIVDRHLGPAAAGAGRETTSAHVASGRRQEDKP
jgi:hypothetical protein